MRQLFIFIIRDGTALLATSPDMMSTWRKLARRLSYNVWVREHLLEEHVYVKCARLTEDLSCSRARCVYCDLVHPKYFPLCQWLVLIFKSRARAEQRVEWVMVGGEKPWSASQPLSGPASSHTRLAEHQREEDRSCELWESCPSLGLSCDEDEAESGPGPALPRRLSSSVIGEMLTLVDRLPCEASV